MNAVNDDRGIEFRRFRSDGSDERQMRDLVFANALLGKPFDEICPCKDWFGDVVLTPYLEMEPGNVHVAVEKDSERVIGYLTGSTGGEEFVSAQHRFVLRRVAQLAASTLMPWNLLDGSRREFVSHLIQNGERELPRHPALGAHWHFQVDADYRGRGIGAKLYERFQSDAMDKGHKLVWAEVMLYPEKPRAYFEDRGWNIHHVLPSRIFGEHVDFPVEVACIEKPLSSEVLH